MPPLLEREVKMSVITETDIKKMTKEQNYMRGYRDGMSDTLDKIRAELKDNILDGAFGTATNSEICAYNGGVLKALNIIANMRQKARSSNDNVR